MDEGERGEAEATISCSHPRWERRRPPKEFLEDSDFGDSFLRQLAQTGSPSVRPVPGEWLGGTDGRRFRILDELGQGGMGLVLRAWDEVLHRTVALKFLAPQARLSHASLLRREARAVARLDHENIVRLLDLSEWCIAPPEERVPFLVMECLEGESLDTLLRRGPLEPLHAVDVLRAVAAGLAHAHARQVIHRDLKPGNVFLTRDGRVKLLDFGLARLAALGTTSPASPLGVGTPAYMAPEQWRGQPQDERTDIWAAGVLLFEMLSGVLPFHPGTVEELRAHVLSTTLIPSIRERRPELPEAVESILARTLAREPRRRYPSAEVLREQVEALARRLDSRRESSPDAAQHRQVTLVQCRLAGFDAGLGPGDVNELVDVFQKRCQQLLQHHGCDVTMGVGDELMGCFGHPVAHEDDSEQAVRAGLALAETLVRELREKLPHLPSEGLVVRVGVHTDRVVMSNPTEEALAVTAISGEAPKVAAWLAREAEPGTVLLSQSTQALVQGAFEVEPLGSRSFAGLARTVDMQVYRLRGERKARSRFERARVGCALTPFVGREPELRLLRHHWSHARRGRGALVLVRGEAGIGKSRLLQELRNRAMRGGAGCWTAQCWRQASNSAFLPVIELLQHLLGFTEAEAPALMRKRLSALGLPAEHTDCLALLLSLPVAEDAPIRLLTSDERKAKTREAFTALLLGKAAERPVLIVLEDLQWADHSTLELVGFLLERISTARLLILLSARSGFSPSWPSRPHLHQLGLERLPAVNAAVLVREVARGGNLSAETVRHLVEKAEGVPLFIEELTRRVLAGAPCDGGALASSIPASLYELLLARLDQLSPRQKALAQLCAVVGRSVTPALLAPLSGEKDGARLEQALSELIEAGVLQEEPSEPADGPRCRFRHALLQDAAYQSLTRSTRRRHHHRIARLLEERFPHVAEAQPERLAHHYTEAGEPLLALRYLRRAGESASERSAYVEAIGHLRQGLALLEALPDVSVRVREEISLRIALGCSQVHLNGYDAPEMAQIQARLQELLRQVDADWLPTDAAYWTPFLCVYSLGRLTTARELASRLLEVGQRLGNKDLLGDGHRLQAFTLLMHGELTAAGSSVEHALALYAKPGVAHPQVIARRKHEVIPPAAVHVCAACIYSLAGQVARAREHERAALGLAEEGGHPHTLAYVRTFLAMTHFSRREARAAFAWSDKVMALCREHGFNTSLAWALVLRAWALAELGQPQEGLQCMQVCLDSRDLGGSQTFLPVVCAVRATILMRLGSLDDGMAAVREGLEWAARTDERFFEAELYRLQGELLHKAAREDEANSSWLQAQGRARQQRARLLELRAAVSLGRQLQAVGRPGEALSVLEQSSEGLDLGFDTPDFQEARQLLSALH